MNCIFCMICDGRIPAIKLYEDEDLMAILDLSQATIGHTLVIPKKHYDNILSIDNNTYLKVMQKVKELAKTITKNLDAKGCNILNNCGAVAGQTINHFHVHIIPRYENDDVKFTFTNNEGKFDLESIKKRILS